MPVTPPDLTPRCLKCGSDTIVPDVRVVDRGDGNARKTAEVSVVTKPEAMLFKGEVSVEMTAAVCGDCGFVELHARHPAALWDAHIDRLSRTF